MPNTYFKFKQFTVQQNQCAQKVCTDACLFGAWTAREVFSGTGGTVKRQEAAPQPEYLQLKTTHPSPFTPHLLDIGTGTGLLALMLAQKTTAAIDAVETERPDFLQARGNFEQSAWSERINAVWTDIKNYRTARQYDCIISNPPFFENDLPSPNKEKQRAKHDSHLTLRQLITEAERLLAPAGILSVLLPFHRQQEFITLAMERQLYPFKITAVQQTPAHPPFRSMLLLSRHEKLIEETNIVIKNDNNTYTAAFTDLLKDYYLYL
jgi:tRNA1Val (adenine37-N6)-methyltransferase